MSSKDGTNRPDGHRKKWDRNEYEKKAKARLREERGYDDDEKYSKKSDRRKDLENHKDRNPREKAVEENDEEWDALDEDWEGFTGKYLSNVFLLKLENGENRKVYKADQSIHIGHLHNFNF